MCIHIIMTSSQPTAISEACLRYGADSNLTNSDLQELGPKVAAKPLQRLSVDNAGRVLAAMSPRAAVSNMLVADNPWAFNTLKGMKESAAHTILADVDIDAAARLMNVSNTIQACEI